MSRNDRDPNSGYDDPFENLPRHTKDDALSPREFELLLEATYRIPDDYYAFQARFVVLVMGRLGLRRGELAHFKADWVDFRRNLIRIPRREPCQKGRDGDICGYCRRMADMRADNNDDLSYRQALGETWRPKTDAAAREVPFDHDPRAHLILERFLDRYDEWPLSVQAVNRRVERAAEHAKRLDPDDIYPHCLRATAGTRLAAKGLDFLPLQSMMGWKCMSTAQKYISHSGEATQRALHMIHSG